ncbi:hypothetical protein [Vibrio parahaemolyticus]|uniref:hypothetical protein n=2 Tax=Vibrio TaxID=662 RepID=UPI001C9C0C19|nr:hypothetical protein [Vibrio parahaemolyticus]MBY7719652.1 hypothetical protein [Vibrio parahaemolyticus]
MAVIEVIGGDVMKGNVYTHVVAEEAERGITIRTSDFPSFGRTTIQAAMSSTMSKVTQAMAVPESYLGTREPDSAIYSAYADLQLAKRILHGKSDQGSEGDIHVTFNTAQDSRFTVDDLQMFQLDMTSLREEYHKTEAARFISWLFECLAGLGVASVDSARQQGYKFLILDNQQTHLRPWERSVERLVVILSPKGDKVAARSISPQALNVLGSVFEEAVSELAGRTK